MIEVYQKKKKKKKKRIMNKYIIYNSSFIQNIMILKLNY